MFVTERNEFRSAFFRGAKGDYRFTLPPGAETCFGQRVEPLARGEAVWRSLSHRSTANRVANLTGHPQTNGKDERFHRTLDVELLQGETFADLIDSQRKFDPS